MRSPHSIPDGLVSERSDAVGRAIDPGAVSLEDLWDEVGRESTNGYRESVFERMGFTVNGDREGSPEIGSEYRF